jgi:myo-inositol catabolism protein IolS
MFKKRRLGRTNLMVSEVGFGGAALSGRGGGYGFGAITEESCQELIEHALDLGINLFDTAPIYGFGVSEKILGKYLHNSREKVIVVNKAGVGWHENGRVNMSNEPTLIAQMLEQSLERMNMDYFDVYMIHWPDARVDIRKPMEILAKAKEAGKIRHIGLSNTHYDDYQIASEVTQISCIQEEFNFLKRNFLKNHLNWVRENDLGVMTWGTLEKGILTGRVNSERQFDQFDARKKAPWFKQKLIDPLILQAQTDSLNLEKALSFNLSYPEVSCALIGMKTIADIDSIEKCLQ